MAWTANLISKSEESGSVLVTVEYIDGAKSFRESYRSTNPSTEWINNTIRSRLSGLSVVSAFNVSTGPVTPTEPATEDPNINLFRSRVKALQAIKVMIDLGAVQADNAKVVALINWIKNNAAYLDYL